MKIQRDKLHQYQKKITVITSRETEIARQCLRNGDKSRALLALRRKKYQESLLSKTDQQLAQLELLTNDVEFALVQKDVIFGLQQGTSVLKQIQKEMGGIENVEKLLGEGEEQKAFQQEVADMLSGRMTNQEEDEVEEELAAMEAQANPKAKEDVKLPDAPSELKERVELPDVPASDPTGIQKARRERHDAEAMAA
jgi:charged multivesicular body protein 6